MSDPKIVTDKSPKFLLGVQRDVMNSQRYVGGVDLSVWGQPFEVGTLKYLGGSKDGQTIPTSDYTVSAPDTDYSVVVTLNTALTDGRVNWVSAPSGYGVVKISNTQWKLCKTIVLTVVGGIDDGAICSFERRINYAPQLSDMSSWTRRGSCSIATTDIVYGIQGYRLSGIEYGGVGDTYKTSQGPIGQRFPYLLIRPVSTSGAIVIQDPYTSLQGRWVVDLSKLSQGWQIITKNSPAVSENYAWSSTNSNAGYQISNASGSGTLSIDIAVSGIYDGPGGRPIQTTSPTIDAITGPILPEGSRIASFAATANGIDWSNASTGWEAVKNSDTQYTLKYTWPVTNPTLVEADLDATIKPNEQLEVRGALTVYNNLTINGKLYITQELGF